MQELHRLITNIIVNTLDLDLDLPISDIQPGWTLREDLGIDSTEMVEIVCAVEATLGFRLSEASMGDWDTLADFCEFVATHQEAASANTEVIAQPLAG